MQTCHSRDTTYKYEPENEHNMSNLIVEPHLSDKQQSLWSIRYVNSPYQIHLDPFKALYLIIVLLTVRAAGEAQTESGLFSRSFSHERNLQMKQTQGTISIHFESFCGPHDKNKSSNIYSSFISLLSTNSWLQYLALYHLRVLLCALTVLHSTVGLSDFYVLGTSACWKWICCSQ